MADADPRLSIGANGPPPIETHRINIEDLYEEAKGFLDGEPILTQAQADSVGILLTSLRAARKAADDQRAIEKRPHDQAAAKVQEAWKPLIAKAELGESVAKQALATFLAAEEARLKAESAKRLEEAATAHKAAQDALRQSIGVDLTARANAEALLKNAGKADRAANKAEKAKPMAAGLGRAVSLRSKWIATLVKPSDALAHYRERQPEDLKNWLCDQADSDVRAGVRTIPGFTITEEKVAQ
jgi:hypothetical protein